jgi:hypothetical protein
MLNGAVEDAPWREQYLLFDERSMHSMGPRKFVRSGLIAAADLKTYDVGQLFACVIGCSDSVTSVGKIWVEYDVDLFVPQNPNAPSSVALGLSTVTTLNGSPVLLINTPTVIPFVGGPTYSPNNTFDGLALFPVNNVTGIITMPLGTFLLVISVSFHSADSVTNGAQYRLQLFKNGALITGGGQTVQTLVTLPTLGAGITFGSIVTDTVLSLTAWFTSTGADTLSVSAFYLQNTGAVNLVGNGGSQMTITKVL